MVAVVCAVTLGQSHDSERSEEELSGKARFFAFGSE
jgi:hypothetical protein